MQTRACSNGQQFIMYVASHFDHKTKNWSASDTRLFLPSLFANRQNNKLFVDFYLLRCFFTLLTVYIRSILSSCDYSFYSLLISYLVIVLSAPADVCLSTVANIARISLHNHFYASNTFWMNSFRMANSRQTATTFD